MLDDGSVEARVRLIRPMEGAAASPCRDEGHAVARRDPSELRRGVGRELAETPAFTESTIHMVTGLLLPIWTKLPNETARVYRLETDTGERIIGRKVPASWAAAAVAHGAADAST